MSSDYFVHSTQILCHVLSTFGNQGSRNDRDDCHRGVASTHHQPQDIEKSDSTLSDNHGQH
jgi:hypothetical protein